MVLKLGYGPSAIKITDLGGGTVSHAVVKSAAGYRSGENPQVVIVRLRRKVRRRFLSPWLWAIALKPRENKENDAGLDLKGEDARIMKMFFSLSAPNIPGMCLPRGSS